MPGGGRVKIRLIRSATILLEYAGKKIIIDPYLAAKHTMPSYTGRSPNPLVELPCEAAQVIEGVDMAIISHLHSDHFDPAAQRLLPPNLLILCQPGDETEIKAKGFQQVVPVIDKITWETIEILRTACQHGSGGVYMRWGKHRDLYLRMNTSLRYIGQAILFGVKLSRTLFLK
jgi:L-ascorbate metabolism protein UlaG (beta-lactamase superfamily)